MKRLSTWFCLLSFGCLFVFAFPAAGASDTFPGALDASFRFGGIFCQFGWSSVSASALQPDGKIILVGECAAYRDYQPPQQWQVLVARLNTDGSADSSFGAGGVVAAQLGLGATPSSFADAVVLQPDGKIVVGGNGFIARLNPDGSFDNSFASGGVERLMGLSVAALTRQPDGKIVAGGGGFIARLNADGSFDTSFAPGGVQPLSGLYVAALALQPDGKIVAAGSGGYAFLVLRLDAGGGLDTTLGSNGIVIDQLGAGESPRSLATAVLVQPNGKIVAAGAVTTGDFWNSDKSLVVRLNANGSLDTSFGTGGKVISDLSPISSIFTTLVLQSDGKLVAAGGALERYDNLAVAVRLIVDIPPVASFGISPDPAVTGQTVTFDGEASNDPDGSITDYEWSFGDGGTATGNLPPHAYATAGSYTVTLTVTDDYGLRTSESSTINVSAPISVISRPAPVLSLLHLRPQSFHAAARGASIATRGGTMLSYQDSLAAKTRFTIDRVLAGRVSGKACVKPTAGNHHAGRCTRYVRLRGTFSHQDRQGPNGFHFTGRLRSHKLQLGRYRLNATPTASGRSGRAVRIGFRIIR